jgi:UDP-glucuronate 4-epimerase
MEKVLVTGAAGFIGYHLAEALLERGMEVVGLDNLNDYYSVNLKLGRLEQLGIEATSVRYGVVVQSAVYPRFAFVKMDLADRDGMRSLFEEERFDKVVNLAAQAGVRYSLENPMAYVDSNIVGFANLLELCRQHEIRHLVYASSSSVYGLNAKMPFSTNDNVDHPISLYAASKKSNELMAHSYSHLFALPTTGLRFFTVYGPWGRPDMAYMLFADAIEAGRPIKVFNEGQMSRDFTFISDIVEACVRVLDHIPEGNPDWNPMDPDPASSKAPWRIYNIGNNSPVRLMDFIEILEEALGKQALKDFMPMQPGDVAATWADVSDLMKVIDYQPGVDLRTGIQAFVEWYKEKRKDY